MPEAALRFRLVPGTGSSTIRPSRSSSLKPSVAAILERTTRFATKMHTGGLRRSLRHPVPFQGLRSVSRRRERRLCPIVRSRARVKRVRVQDPAVSSPPENKSGFEETGYQASSSSGKSLPGSAQSWISASSLRGSSAIVSGVERRPGAMLTKSPLSSSLTASRCVTRYAP